MLCMPIEVDFQKVENARNIQIFFKSIVRQTIDGGNPHVVITDKRTYNGIKISTCFYGQVGV